MIKGANNVFPFHGRESYMIDGRKVNSFLRQNAETQG